MRPAPSRFPLVPLPSRRTVLVAVCVVVAVVSVLRLTSRASATIDEYGETTTAFVATTDLGVGATIGAGDVVAVRRPVAHLPDRAMAEDPVGAVVASAVGAGEVVVSGRLGTTGRSGPAALVPEGWRAVTITSRDGVLPASVGQRVDVVGVLDPGTGRALVLVRDAVVVATDGGSETTVAVPADTVPTVVGVLVGGVVTLTLVG